MDFIWFYLIYFSFSIISFIIQYVHYFLSYSSSIQSVLSGPEPSTSPQKIHGAGHSRTQDPLRVCGENHEPSMYYLINYWKKSIMGETVEYQARRWTERDAKPNRVGSTQATISHWMPAGHEIEVETDHVTVTCPSLLHLSISPSFLLSLCLILRWEGHVSIMRMED